MGNKTLKNEQLVDDPRELLLSLVDMGSLDIEDALMACVKEMSDAECKRVLSGLSLPNCCDMEEPEDEESPAEASEEPEQEDMPEEPVVTDELVDEESDADEDSEDDAEAELEARIRRLERCVRRESMNRNRVRRVFRRNSR
jgi:hypothetical protein